MGTSIHSGSQAERVTRRKDEDFREHGCPRSGFSFPNYAAYWEALAFVGKRLLVMTLLLIGMGLTKDVLRKIGVLPLVHGVALWVVVSISKLAAIVGGTTP